MRGGTLVTQDPARRVFRGDLLVTDGRIAAVGEVPDPPPATRLLDADGMFVLPGFVQGHVHFGQALFRGLAEDRELLPWLRERIWPLEAAHDEESAYWSARLAAAECLLSGTTTVQDIGIVRGMHGLLRGMADGGVRAVAGKCLMDRGEGAPAALLQPAAEGLAEAEALHREWHGAAGGRITGLVCPRFVLSCSGDLWRGAVDLAGRLGVAVHTHLLESRAEEWAVLQATGEGQMEFLEEHGVLDTELRIAHGVRFGPAEAGILDGRPLSVIHCPSTNLKLDSGIADLVSLRRWGLTIGIGCDGPPCNNDLDVLEEMRLAHLLQQGKQGPGVITAQDVLDLGTIEGAKAIGLADEIGSLEPGKRGDLVVLDPARPASFAADGVAPADRIVPTVARDAVRFTVVDGEVLVDAGRLLVHDGEEILRRAGEEIAALVARAELPGK